ncbi:hypothetical protein [Methylocystis sp. S23]
MPRRIISLLAPAIIALFFLAARDASAQPYYGLPGYYGHHPHRHGCFVTTSPQHHTKGVRHWRNPCPYVERRHLNPYYPGYHRPYRPHPHPH